MKPQESAALAEARWARLRLIQDYYSDFVPFLEDVMTELGFSTTEIQKDIGLFMQHGPLNLMVQAQRSQAKTTIAAAFAVWCLIHSPSHRVLILSAGGTQASEISTLIVRIIMTMDVLECMRPDRMAGDRTSTEAFDLHHSIKGLDKSPSVACVGIDSNLQGKRADLLIADDIESSKNSATPMQRAKLLHLTKDFDSIVTNGRILWLGTPQTNESIYNALPARGVTVRIWPGRYPTQKQRLYYGARLAPYIVRKLSANPTLDSGGGLLGNQGQPLDPVLLPEEKLQAKELSQGEAYFQLQHMLNTELSDSMRYPLKPELLVLLRGSGERYPLEVIRGMLSTHIVEKAVHDYAFKLSLPQDVSQETARLQSIWATIDPAAGGANADETAYAIGGFLNGKVVLLSVGGIPGGYTEDKLEELAKRLARFPIDGVTIEKNMGYGAFAAVFTPILRKHIACQIDEDLVSGNKERRIINTLAPVMGRGSLIVTPEAVEEDSRDCERYPAAQRSGYSLFKQLATLSAVSNALPHDDRADAVEALVRHFNDRLAQDQAKQLAAQREREWAEKIKDPLGHNRFRQQPGARFTNLRRNRR